MSQSRYTTAAILILAIGFTLLAAMTGHDSLPIVHAQESLGLDSLTAPITALWADESRLLLGYDDNLMALAIVPGDPTQAPVLWARALGRHEIRAIAVMADGAYILALAEDGLTVLDAGGVPISYLSGGGQSLAVAGDRLYIMARQAGIRQVQLLPDGSLAFLGNMRTADVISSGAVTPDTPGQVWAAEGALGVRLYDATDPTHPAVLVWLSDLAPARLVRLDGTRLYVAHESSLSILDISNPLSPRLIGHSRPEASASSGSGPITDLEVMGSRAFVAHETGSGPGVLELDVTRPAEISLVNALGDQGGASHLARDGDALFVALAAGGLQRMYVGRARPMLMASWAVGERSPACGSALPIEPDPPDFDQHTGPGHTITLRWRSSCLAAHEITVNGITYSVAAPESPPEGDHYHYDVPLPPSAVVAWRVTTIQPDGTRLTGPTWRFALAPEGWLAAPPLWRDWTGGPVLYRRPLIDLNTPGGFMGALCLAVLAGLGVIISAAWLLGQRSERRLLSRL